MKDVVNHFVENYLLEADKVDSIIVMALLVVLLVDRGCRWWWWWC